MAQCLPSLCRDLGFDPEYRERMPTAILNCLSVCLKYA